MFAQVHYPESLLPEELDDYLAEGWFRNGQRIFTTNFLNFGNQLYSAIWLRIDLQAHAVDKGLAKLKKLNAQFEIRIQKASITPEKEELFQKYKTSVPFSAAQSLQTLLFGDSKADIFSTYEILLYDKGKIIAVGYFDLGLKSAAGITSFYDPEYKRSSLGKYLIYLKIEYCKKNQYDFFYPGYFAPQYPAFDYKLNIAKENLSFLALETNTWISIDAFQVEQSPYQKMLTNLMDMETVLKQTGVECTLFKYTFFEANIIPNLRGLKLFDFPLFLTCFIPASSTAHTLIVYDVIYKCFHLVECKSVWKADDVEVEKGFYSEHLLKLSKHICSAKTVEEMAAILMTTVQSKADSNS